MARREWQDAPASDTFNDVPNCPHCNYEIDPTDLRPDCDIAYVWHFVHCGYNHPSEQPRLTHEKAMERKAKRLEASMSSEAKTLESVKAILRPMAWYHMLSGDTQIQIEQEIARLIRDAARVGYDSRVEQEKPVVSGDWANQAAHIIMQNDGIQPSQYPLYEAIVAGLAAAHARGMADAARVPEGYVRTADGVDRKVLGTLPITADGCVPGLGASVSWPGYGEEYVYDGHVRYSLVWAASIPVESSTPVRDCYSTREAAESALTQPTPAKENA